MLTTYLRKPRFGFNTHGNVIPLPQNQSERNVTIIAAMDNRNGIGIDNRMPWHVPPDTEQFKRLTMGNAVVMGRKTFESLGSKPLPGRTNVVLSRDEEARTRIAKSHRDVIVSPTFKNILDALEVLGKHQIFIIGGGEIYRQALDQDLVDDMILTRFQKQAACDTFFPDFDPDRWQGPIYSTHEHIRLRFRYEYLWRKKNE